MDVTLEHRAALEAALWHAIQRLVPRQQWDALALYQRALTEMIPAAEAAAYALGQRSTLEREGMQADRRDEVLAVIAPAQKSIQ
jgi:hypothetical protein